VQTKTDYLARKRAQAEAVHEHHAQQLASKDAKLDRLKQQKFSIEADIDRAELDRAQLQRKQEKIRAGYAKSLERYEQETQEQQCAREFKARIREWHRDIRFQLSGKRLAKNNGSSAVTVFDYVYRKWSRRGRPESGVPCSEAELCKALRLPRITVSRALKKLCSVLIRNKVYLRRKAGRLANTYSFQTFPDRDAFVREFEATFV